MGLWRAYLHDFSSWKLNGQDNVWRGVVWLIAMYESFVQIKNQCFYVCFDKVFVKEPNAGKFTQPRILFG